MRGFQIILGYPGMKNKFPNKENKEVSGWPETSHLQCSVFEYSMAVSTKGREKGCMMQEF